MLTDAWERFGVGQVVIWGKSMGAVAAVEYLSRWGGDGVVGVVLDSPFQKLRTCLENIGRQQGYFSICLAISLNMIESRVKDILGFDLFAIDYLESFKAADLRVPILFAGSRLDDIVKAEEVAKFYSAYPHEKALV